MQASPGRIRLWALALLAVLTGNALYFWGLVPRLPASWEHRPFRLDRGLLLDFACCLALYLALLLASARRAGPRRQ